jgi:hypothetical protein
LANEDYDSAYDALIEMLRSYGLESLAPAVLTFLQDGYTQDQVSVMIQDTPEYKERFSGNDIRRQKGLAALSPRDYLNVEAAYRQILSTYGMPIGFYDSPSDFASWIGEDVSPQEIQSRVTLAVDAANELDDGTLTAFRDWYGVGATDLAAFFLDRDRAMPHIQKIAKAVQIGGVANRDGLDVTRERAEQLGGLAGNRDARELMSQVAEVTRRGDALSNIYGGEDYRQSDAENEVCAQSESARRKRLRLSQYEEAAFGGTSGVGQATLGKSTSGI